MEDCNVKHKLLAKIWKFLSRVEILARYIELKKLQLCEEFQIGLKYNSLG